MAEIPQREPVFLKLVITKDVYLKLADFKEKWKGEKTHDVVVRINTSDTQATESEYSMSEFLEALGLADADSILERPCETCGGSGELSAMEAVYSGEPHQADVGTRPCPDCAGHEEEAE